MQKKKEKLQKLISTLLIITYIIFPMRVYAAGLIDINKDVSLSVTYSYGGKAIQGAEFKLYRVAEVNAYGSYSPTAAFSPYPISLDGVEQQGWRTLALTLYGYIQRDKISEIDRGVMNSTGVLNFPTGSKSLKPGLYLMTVARCSLDGYIYTAAPFMLALPYIDKKTNDWSYSTLLSPKYEREKEPSGDNYPYINLISHKVIKVWEEEEGSERPAEIRADILRNGVIYDTAVLSKENNWRHTWDKLEASYEWTVVEKETEGYTTLIERSGNIWVITNTKKPDKPEEPKPYNPPHETPKDKLPQTGMVWWPVQLLAISGILLLIIGVLRKRRGRDGE